jgi:hypothetical protein
MELRSSNPKNILQVAPPCIVGSPSPSPSVAAEPPPGTDCCNARCPPSRRVEARFLKQRTPAGYDRPARRRLTRSSPGLASWQAPRAHPAVQLRRSVFSIHRNIEQRVSLRFGASSQVRVTRARSYLESLLQVLVQLQDGRDIAASVAVVGRRPDGHQSVVEHGLVALHHKLMRSADQLDVVRLIELLSSHDSNVKYQRQITENKPRLKQSDDFAPAAGISLVPCPQRRRRTGSQRREGSGPSHRCPRGRTT